MSTFHGLKTDEDDSPGALRRLEERMWPLRSVARYDTEATDRLRGVLPAADFVIDPVESLAEVWARAIGTTCVELRALLERRAAGLPVE